MAIDSLAMALLVKFHTPDGRIHHFPCRPDDAIEKSVCELCHRMGAERGSVVLYYKDEKIDGRRTYEEIAFEDMGTINVALGEELAPLPQFEAVLSFLASNGEPVERPEEKASKAEEKNLSDDIGLDLFS